MKILNSPLWTSFFHSETKQNLRSSISYYLLHLWAYEAELKRFISLETWDLLSHELLNKCLTLWFSILCCSKYSQLFNNVQGTCIKEYGIDHLNYSIGSYISFNYAKNSLTSNNIGTLSFLIQIKSCIIRTDTKRSFMQPNYQISRYIHNPK